MNETLILEIIFWSALFMVGGSLILGRAAARHRDGILDSIIRVFSYIGIAVRPSWWQLCCWSYSEIYAGNPNAWAIEYRGGTAGHHHGLLCAGCLVQGQFSTAWDAFLHLLLPAFALSLGGMFQDAR